MRFSLAQITFRLGDIDHQISKILDNTQKAAKDGASLIAFPENCLTGYPLDDLLYHDSLFQAIDRGLNQLQKTLPPHMTCVISHPIKENGAVFLAASVIQSGKITHRYRKQSLINTHEFDEKRYYTAGNEPLVFIHQGHRIGLLLCEDLWQKTSRQSLMALQPDLILCLNSSPYSIDKKRKRLEIIKQSQQEWPCPIAYVNTVGGHDEWLFDGRSTLFLSHESYEEAPAFQEHLSSFTLPLADTFSNPDTQLPEHELAILYQGLCTGLRDYVSRLPSQKVCLGLSGGLDSALVLALAVDALGPEHVTALFMPSQFTSPMSMEDAEALAANTGVHFYTFPIQDMFEANVARLKSYGLEITQLAKENLQARIRGQWLMAYANTHNALLLSTGNKSELAMGYTTLYGDMCGGFNPIKDIYKTTVLALAAYRNQLSPMIPERCLSRPPSAELAHDQKDSDSLPEYPILDRILKCFIENNEDAGVIQEKTGLPMKVIGDVLETVQRMEFKRRQSTPGIRVSGRSFDRGRRMPMQHFLKHG